MYHERIILINFLPTMFILQLLIFQCIKICIVPRYYPILEIRLPGIRSSIFSPVFSQNYAFISRENLTFDPFTDIPTHVRFSEMSSEEAEGRRDTYRRTYQNISRIQECVRMQTDVS